MMLRRVTLPRYQKSWAHGLLFPFPIIEILPLDLGVSIARPFFGLFGSRFSRANCAISKRDLSEFQPYSVAGAVVRRGLATRKIVAGSVWPRAALLIKWAKVFTATARSGAAQGDCDDAVGTIQPTLQTGRRGAACDPAQRVTPGRPPAWRRVSCRPISPSCPGAGAGFPAVLPAQSETVSAYRCRRAGRSRHSGTRRGPRYPHRFAALPRLAGRRGGRRAERYPDTGGATISSLSPSAARFPSNRRCSRAASSCAT